MKDETSLSLAAEVGQVLQLEHTQLKQELRHLKPIEIKAGQSGRLN